MYLFYADENATFVATRDNVQTSLFA